MKQTVSKDHLGNEYSSFNQMCSAYGMQSGTVKWRLDNGWDLKKALTHKNEIEFNGKKYSSLSKLCREYGISHETQNKIAKGVVTLEKAVSDAIKLADSRTDHLGRKFNSVQQMCEFWGIDRDCYISRIRYGWNKEKALTTGVNKRVSDYYGNNFRSFDNLCYCYRLDKKYVEDKMLEGLSLNDIISTYGNINIAELKYVDHIGNRFYTIEDMCKYWRIGIDLYKHGIQHGRNFHSILNEAIRIENIKAKENDGVKKIWRAPDGKEYTSFRSMCREYNVCPETARQRLKKGLSLSEALANRKYTKKP